MKKLRNMFFCCFCAALTVATCCLINRPQTLLRADDGAFCWNGPMFSVVYKDMIEAYEKSMKEK